MADFSAVLKKTIDKLKENTPEAREKIYQKARATIEAKLAAITPPPPANVATRQRKLLEDAITSVEAEYAAPLPEPETAEDDLDAVFAELDAAEKAPDVPVAEEETVPPAAPVSEGEGLASDWTPSAPDVMDEPAPEEPNWQMPVPEQAEEEPLQEDTADGGAGDFPALQDETPAEPRMAKEEAVVPPLAGTPPRRRRRSGLIAALLLLVLAGAGYAGWHYRDDLTAMVSNLQGNLAPVEEETDQAADSEADAGSPQEAASDEIEEPATTPRRKFTQRLTPDGREIDAGPADGEPGLGEGTSVAQASAPQGTDPSGGAVPDTAESGGETQPAGGNDGGDQPLATNGQRAIFYEERTNVSQGSADAGSVVWSLVQESPGNDLPPEPAIRAEATIPQKNLQLKMTIRRNADRSLPASHMIEIIFLTPDNFEGGGIDNVLRIALKRSEQDAGNPLLGIPAKIADGFFLVALSDSGADIQTNTLLLRRQDWIDIPVVYKSGRRALITIEKGTAGEQIFNEALNAWQNASSG